MSAIPCAVNPVGEERENGGLALFSLPSRCVRWQVEGCLVFEPCVNTTRSLPGRAAPLASATKCHRFGVSQAACMYMQVLCPSPILARSSSWKLVFNFPNKWPFQPQQSGFRRAQAGVDVFTREKNRHGTFVHVEWPNSLNFCQQMCPRSKNMALDCCGVKKRVFTGPKPPLVYAVTHGADSKLWDRMQRAEPKRTVRPAVKC